jgi:putative lipoic acid-binding regulatory protein
MFPKVDIASFKEKLDQQHGWPTLYMFKFIVPSGKEEEVFALFPKNQLTTKASRKGNYVSVTAKVMMRSSEDVMAKYRAAHKIEGVLAL